MKHSYTVKPHTELTIDRVLKRVTKPPVRQTPVALPGAEVVDHFPSGQPKTYRYRGRNLSRRQYQQLIREMRTLGLIEAKPPKKGPERGSDSDRDETADSALRTAAPA